VGVWAAAIDVGAALADTLGRCAFVSGTVAPSAGIEPALDADRLIPKTLVCAAIGERLRREASEQETR
jgi:hypothetical protein